MKLSQTLIALALLVVGLALISCSDSDPVAPPVIDSAPPAVPTGLVAFSSRAYVRLTWDANTTDTDFGGFRVYRVSGEQSTLLSATLFTSPAFLDLDPVAGCIVYAVAAVDVAGNESAWLRFAYNCADTDVDIGIE